MQKENLYWLVLIPVDIFWADPVNSVLTTETISRIGFIGSFKAKPILHFRAAARSDSETADHRQNAENIFSVSSATRALNRGIIDRKACRWPGKLLLCASSVLTSVKHMIYSVRDIHKRASNYITWSVRSTSLPFRPSPRAISIEDGFACLPYIYRHSFFPFPKHTQSNIMALESCTIVSPYFVASKYVAKRCPSEKHFGLTLLLVIL